MSLVFPPPSGIAAITKRAAISASSASGKNLSPVFVVMISAAVLAVCMASLCMWRRLLTRDVVQYVPFRHRHQIARRRENFGDHEDRRRPKMFDAWIEQHISSGLKWEEYRKPISVTVSIDAEAKRASGPVRKVKKHRRDGARGCEDHNQGSCSIQLAVVVSMPSPLPRTKHYGSVDQELSGSPLGGELAIGLVKFPWLEENHRLLDKTAS